MANTALNRSTVLLLTNKSGADRAYGATVILDSSTASSFTTTTSANQTDDLCGVIVEPNGIASNATGLVCVQGYVAKITLTGSASLGDYVFTATTAAQAARSGTKASGAFGQVLGTGTTPAAVLWGAPVPAGAAAGPAGELGQVAVTSSFSTASTTFVDVTSATVTVTVGTRAINIVAYIPQVDFSSGTAARITLALLEDGTQIQGAYPYITDASKGQTVCIAIRRAPAAGSHTYKLQMLVTAAHTGRLFADATDPITIYVNEV